MQVLSFLALWAFLSLLRNHEQFADLDSARLSVFKYIETFYNAERLHRTLDYNTPNKYEAEPAPS
ncbi:MAG: IS3 family transposase [Pirellulales bacterium]